MRMANAEVVSSRYQCIRRVRQTMTKHPEIWGVIAAVVFTLCTKYTQSQPRILLAPQPHPRRFFPSTSPVLDFPYGNIGPVADLLQDEGVLFVMYYAPWCANSMRARPEFERAATYLQDQITFVGINCWHDSGQCRQQNTFSTYPIIFAYHTTLDGFRYTGILEADYMVAFLERLIYPLTRLNDRDEIGAFLAQKDHVVVGFFDFHVSPQPPGFDQFYYASMRSIEKDPSNPVVFGVVTSRAVAEGFHLPASQRTILITRPFEETLRYGENLNFTSSAIIQWVVTTKALAKQSLKWMVPAGTKSLSLSSEVQSGPTLILFTPDSPVSPINHHFSMFREISLAYHNCKNVTRINNVIASSLYVRLTTTMRHLEALETCRKKSFSTEEAEKADRVRRTVTVMLTCCSSVVPTGAPTASNSCDVCTHYLPIHPLSSQHCPLVAIPDLPWGLLLPVAPPCRELRASYNPSEYISMCCGGTAGSSGAQHYQHRPTTTTTTTTHYPSEPESFRHTRSKVDPYVAHAMSQAAERQCRTLRLQRTFGWLPMIHTPGLRVDHSTPEELRLTGLGCQTNRSINFFAMNTKHSAMFADRLGVKFGAKPSLVSSAVVLLDDEREVQYIMEGDITRSNVVTWLHNLTEGMVRRSMRSREDVSWSCDQKVDSVCLKELSSNTFTEVVMDTEKDVVVLYQAPWCGFCVAFAHIYLTLARYFRTSENIVFARINADSNDLPWEMTVDNYPTIHFFPAHRKVDSVSFPNHLSKTLPNLLQFVLRYATSDLRLQTGLSICTRGCILNNQVRIARRLQELHGEMHLLQRRAWLVSQRILQLRQAIVDLSKHTSSLDSPVMAVYHASIPSLREYVFTIRQRIRWKRLQLRSARDLHSALLTSQGVYIDKHKLTAILRTHQQLQVSLKEIEKASQDPATANDASEVSPDSATVNDTSEMGETSRDADSDVQNVHDTPHDEL